MASKPQHASSRVACAFSRRAWERGIVRVVSTRRPATDAVVYCARSVDARGERGIFRVVSTRSPGNLGGHYCSHRVTTW